MKNLLLTLSALVSLHLGATATHVCLQAALSKRLVEVRILSLGGHEGYCIQMTLKNLTKDSLIVSVEPGRRLNSVNNKEQDILVVKEELVALRHHQSKSVKVKGYCCQASNNSPSKGATYAAHGMADSGLVRLARLMNLKQFNGHGEQEAIWALSDGHATAYISAEDDSLTQVLREKIALLRGEELPWYRIISRRYANPGGGIRRVNLRLLGEMSYSNDQENYATLSIKNEQGLLVCQVKSEWLKATANERYKLDLSIKELASGKYTIALSTPEKELARREFEL